MRRYAISGLALTVAVLGGCSTAPTRVGLDPDVEYVQPGTNVVYTPPPTTTVATAPATTTVIAPPTTTVVQASGLVAAADPAPVRAPTEITTSAEPATTVIAAPGTTVVSAPGTTVVPAPGSVVVAPGTTTVEPAPGTVVSTPPPAAIPQMLRADEIETQRVRAHTIYANRIEADEIRGLVHQDRNLKIVDTKGAIKGGPEVVASVIYADEIKANSVVAEHIYVRNLRRR